MGRPGTTARVTLAVFALAAGPSFTACGGDDADAFKEDYNAAVKPLAQANSEVSGAIEGEADRSNAAIAEQFENLAQKSRQTHENLAALDPPEDAKDAYDELLAAVEKGTKDLRAVAEAANDSDPEAARTAQDSLESSAEEIKQAETALQRAVDG
jgi:chromosome segregation ATPase